MLQGHFSGTLAKDQSFDSAVFKVIRASIIAEDWEVVVPLEEGQDDVDLQVFKTVHKGQAVLMVWADAKAYENRAVPLNVFMANFEVDVDSSNNLLMAHAYEAGIKVLNETFPDHEYSYV